MDNKIPDAVEAKADASNAQQTPTPPAPPTVERYENGEGAECQGGGKQVAKNEDDPPHWTRYVEVFCAIALVLITGTYTYYAGEQTRASIDAVTETRDAVKVARDTLTETQTSNKEQRRQSAQALQATIDNFHQDQRAWIILSEMSVDGGSLKDGSPIAARIKMTNSGKTPALHVTLETATNNLTPGHTPNFAIKREKGFKSFDQIIFPNNSPDLVTEKLKDTSGHEAILTESEKQKFARGEYLFYVWGSVYYFDVYEAPHMTRFCAVMNPDLTTFHQCKQKYADAN